MFSFPPAGWLAALPALAALTLSAQEATPAAASAPADALAFRSALQGYRPFADEPVMSWKEANDTVGRIGGWRSYAREAEQAETPAAAPPKVGPKPGPGTSPPSHGGHGGHHGGRP